MPELLSIYRTGLKNDSIVGQKLKKRIACTFRRCGSSKCALRFDNREPVRLTCISFLGKRKGYEGQPTNQNILANRKPALNALSTNSGCHFHEILPWNIVPEKIM